MTTTIELEPKEESVNCWEEAIKRESINPRIGDTERLKKYYCPEWQKRSSINDVFCRYGSYYS